MADTYDPDVSFASLHSPEHIYSTVPEFELRLNTTGNNDH